MDTVIGLILFLGKWVFIGLIYLMLIVVLVAVRREMKQKLQNPEMLATTIAGRLRVLQSGTDPALTPGHILNLPTKLVVGADRKQLNKDDLIIRDPFISGRHAQLSWDGVHWWLEDLDSANGSRVNGQECPPRTKVSVPIGGTVEFGDVVFELLS